jgi:hypothetical protein
VTDDCLTRESNHHFSLVHQQTESNHHYHQHTFHIMSTDNNNNIVLKLNTQVSKLRNTIKQLKLELANERKNVETLMSDKDCEYERCTRCNLVTFYIHYLDDSDGDIVCNWCFAK